ARHPILNLATFVRSSPEELLALAREILAIQDLLGTRRHLVVLAHPWEFGEVGLPGCSPDNYARLLDRTRLLTDVLGVEMATLSQVARRAIDRGDEPREADGR